MQETNEMTPEMEIKKAKIALNEAKILFEAELYDGAASRSYYAAFHAMSALLANDGYRMKKHSGVISKFRELYIKTGIFDVSMSEQISDLFELRTRCDYGNAYAAEKADVEELIVNAETIITAIEERLSIITENQLNNK